jgi:hypothetical protein
MTLIVGFRCQDAAVLCADSQETRAGLKTEVNKLPVWAAQPGGMDIVCGGAGNGDLIDAFRASLAPQMTSSTTCGEDSIRRELEAALVGFHQGAVFSAYPASQEDKGIAGLIAVRSAARQVFLYKFFGTVIQAVDTYGLAGEDYSYFERLTQRRYRPGLSIHQAMLIGLEIINEAKDTSATIGKTTRVVIATASDGMRSQPRERIEWTEAEITTQNRLFDDLRFELSSTSAETQENLWKFSNSITSMRGVYGSKYLAWPKLTIGETTDDSSD